MEAGVPGCSQSVCDLLHSTTAGSRFPSPFTAPPPPLLFCVLIVPTVSPGGGGVVEVENGGWGRGLSSLCHRGLHECSRCGEG